MSQFPCDGEPRVCPGRCNPANNIRREAQPYHHQENVVSHNVYYRQEFSLFSKKTQTDAAYYDEEDEALTPEERRFLEALTRRIDARRRERRQVRAHWGRKLAAFLVFFFVHGCVASLTRNYQQYQAFIATQLCGFVTLMFWDEG